MYYKKVPDDFSVLNYGYENFCDRNGIFICRVIESLHKDYQFSLKSLLEKIVKELEDDNVTEWYTSRTSDIFLTPRERKTMPKINGFWVSHYFKRNS